MFAALASSLAPLGGLLAAIVFVAFLVGRFAPTRRRRVRRTFILFAFAVAALAASAALSAVGQPAWAGHALVVSGLLRTLAFINLGGILFFDLTLPAVRLPLPDIAHDLTLGAAYIVATIVTLHSRNVPLDSLVATSAVVTAVIGLSLQTTLGNILGGVALQLDDSIRVGDWVRLGDGSEGRVREIHWRHTVVETRNWDTIIVPNSTLLASNIVILGKRGGEAAQHRMWVWFNVDFRYEPARVIEVAQAALRAAPIKGVAAEPPPNCVCMDFAGDRRDSFARYAVRYYLTDLAADDPTSSEVRLRLFAALRRAGIPLAVPAATLFMSQDDPVHAERKAAREHERRLRALDGVDLFTPLTSDEKEQIARQLSYAPFSAGEVVTRQGAEAHWLYILMQGKVEIRIAGDDGASRVVATVEAPSFIGEMSLMTGAPRSATVVALSEVECYRLDRDSFWKTLQARPELAHELSAILAQRQVELMAARGDLDAEGRRRRLATERNRILNGIQRFFGLDDSRPTRGG